MPKITSIKQQQNNPHRFDIFIDDKFFLGVDEDLLVEYRLITGKEVDQETLANLNQLVDVGKWMDRMYGLFAIRQRSEKEIRDYFRIKLQTLRAKRKEEISDLVIETVIQKLKNKGLINDLQFAKDWIEARRKSKQKGNLALKSELIQKGISREIIEEVLNNELIEQSNNQEVLAQQALDKKLKSWNKFDRLVFKKKAHEYLARKGFNYDTIRGVVEKYLKRE